MMKSLPRATRAAAPEELWLLLTEFALSMRGWWISTCSGLDLTPVQGLALKLLDPDSPLAMSALADTLACDASNVTGVVDKLEARGLIARHADENDRRVKVLVVTAKGRELRGRLLAQAAKPPAEILEMPKKVRDQLIAGLRSFLAGRRPEDLDSLEPHSTSGPAKSASTRGHHRGVA
jgi:MarR family transcriptional regulator, organic hydroperoxide resistance regulator